MYRASHDWRGPSLHFCEPVSFGNSFGWPALGAGSGCKQTQLLEKPMKLAYFVRVQNSHCGFEFRGMAAEDPFHDTPPIHSQLQHLCPPVAWRLCSYDETLFLQAINRRGHRAAGQQHLVLDFGDCQRTLVQEGFESSEIREAQ